MTIPAEPRLQKNSTWIWRLVLLVAGLCVVCVLALIGWQRLLLNQVNSQLHKKLDKIRAAGEPITPEELNTYYPAVPDAQNAALIYGQAFTAISNSASRGFLESFAGLQDITNSLPQPLREQMEKAVSENQTALEKLRRASELTACRYPVDYRPGWGALLPQLTHLQRCADLELCNGVLHEQKGDTDAAIDSAILISKYAKSLDSEPDLISVMVRQKIDRHAFDLFEWILNHKKLSRQQLLRFQEVITNSEQKDWVHRAVIGERCFNIATFDYSINEFLSVIMPNRDYYEDSAMLEIKIQRLTGRARRDEITCIDRLAQIQEASRLELPPRLDRIEELRAEINREAAQERFFVTGSLLPGFMNAFARDAEHIARIHLAQTALAIELFRMAHGALPADLKDLVPAYLPLIPPDPFAGEPLQYKKRNSGYLLYSIGPDRVDDGGEKRLSEKRNANLSSKAVSTGDIIFSVDN